MPPCLQLSRRVVENARDDGTSTLNNRVGNFSWRANDHTAAPASFQNCRKPQHQNWATRNRNAVAHLYRVLCLSGWSVCAQHSAHYGSFSMHSALPTTPQDHEHLMAHLACILCMHTLLHLTPTYQNCYLVFAPSLKLGGAILGLWGCPRSQCHKSDPKPCIATTFAAVDTFAGSGFKCAAEDGAIWEMLLQRHQQPGAVEQASLPASPPPPVGPRVRQQCLWLQVRSLQVPAPRVTQSERIQSSPASHCAGPSGQPQSHTPGFQLHALAAVYASGPLLHERPHPCRYNVAT